MPESNHPIRLGQGDDQDPTRREGRVGMERSKKQTGMRQRLGLKVPHGNERRRYEPGQKVSQATCLYGVGHYSPML